jgi:hypothetical protein
MGKRAKSRKKRDKCQPLRDRLEKINARILEILEFLPEAPISQRPVLLRELARLQSTRTQVLRLLAACESSLANTSEKATKKAAKKKSR